MKKFAILVAGGKGTRMQSDTPKQFMLLKGEPVIIHTLKVFLAYDARIKLIVVLPEEHLQLGQELVAHHLPDLAGRIKFCVGGTTRFQSVRNGLLEINEDGLVAIHDAVRPLVTDLDIGKTFDLAGRLGAAILVTDVKESLRKLDGDGSIAVTRSLYRSVQTPQTFSVQLLKEAYQQKESMEFTDDASVFEKAGYPVHLVEGSYRNIKITTPEDLLTAEVMLR